MSATADETLNNPRYREVRKVTLIGSVVDFLLGVAKIIVGWLAHSQALIADGVHSLSDLATDFSSSVGGFSAMFTESNNKI